MKKSNRYDGFVLDEYDIDLYIFDNLARIKKMFYLIEKRKKEKVYFYFISKLLNSKEQEVLYIYGILQNDRTKELFKQEGIEKESIEAATILLQSEIQSIKNNPLSKAVKIAMLQEDIVFFTEEENIEKVKELQEKIAYIQGN